MTHKKRKMKIAVISWLAVLILSIVLFFIARGFIVFPKQYTWHLAGALAALALLTGVLSFLIKKGKSAVMTVINVILSLCMAAGSIYLPILQKQMVDVFEKQDNTEEIVINAYVMNEEYIAAHPELYTTAEISYADGIFLTEAGLDPEETQEALQQLAVKMERPSLNVVEKETIDDALAALYANEGQVLLIDETQIDMIEEMEGYEAFSSQTKILDSVTQVIEVEPEPVKEEDTRPLSERPFQIFLGGADTRANKLSSRGRKDVDIILTVNPLTKQIMLTTIPRDFYVRDKALGNRFDKLTHTGNHGMGNMLNALNNLFETDLRHWMVVNFRTFKNIIDALGGVDVDNPYAFHSTADTGGNMNSQNYSFKKGKIHLSGDQALAYVRERHNLKNGDFGRNEHQMIVIKAVINKLTSSAILSKAGSVLNSLQKQFLTDLSSEDIWSLINAQINTGGSWSFITYHLSGRPTSAVTASANAPRSVVYPYKQQIFFVREQMQKMLNGENVTQETMPNDDKEYYLP